MTVTTYFRHFADEREVFFDGEEQLRRLWLEALAALLAAAGATVPLLEANRPVVERRRPVIAATPALRERELAKATHLVEVLAEALGERGLAPGRALLAAQVGFAAITRATAAWYVEPAPPGGEPGSLTADLVAALAELGELTSELSTTPRTARPQAPRD